MRRTLAALLLLLSPVMVEAATITPLTCGHADVQAAYKAAAPVGDVIQVPAGDCTWTAQMVFNAGKSVIVRGAGVGLTIIRDGFGSSTGWIWQVPAGGYGRLSGVSIEGSAQNANFTPFLLVKAPTPTPAEPFGPRFRLDHTAWNYGRQSQHRSTKWTFENMRGVVDNSTFTTVSGGWALIELPKMAGVGARGHKSWAEDSSFGTTDQVVIEDVTFTRTDPSGAQTGVEGDLGGGRYTVRKSVIDGHAVGGHGHGTGNHRGMRHIEVYDTTFQRTYATTGAFVFLMRSGTALTWRNLVRGVWNVGHKLWSERVMDIAGTGGSASCDGTGVGGANGGNCWDVNDPTTYESGTMTAGSTLNVVEDTTKSWTVNEWANAACACSYVLTDTTNKLGGMIVSNTATTLTVSPAANGPAKIFAAGHTYFIKKVLKVAGQAGQGKGAYYPYDSLGANPGVPVNINTVDEPIYSWGNTHAGIAAAAFIAKGSGSYHLRDGKDWLTDTGTMFDCTFSEGDDKAKIKVGTAAQMATYSGCTSGAGFWVTDEGSWDTTKPANTSGRMYRWNGSAWMPWYGSNNATGEPLAYPHEWTVCGDLADVACKAPTPVIVSGPASPTNQTAASFTFSNGDPNAIYLCALDDSSESAFAACTSPQVYESSTGSHTFYLKARDAFGNESDVVPFTWAIDLLAPQITMSGAPLNPSQSTSASFSFFSSEASSFACQLDGNDPISCSPDPGNPDDATKSAAQYMNLAQGTHTFTVTARDTADNTGSATFTWTIDQTGPTLSLTSAPLDPTNSNTASFAFEASEPSSLACELTGPMSFAPEPCGSTLATTGTATYIGLGEGFYVFTLLATDEAGNTGTTSFGWVVDQTPPTIVFATPTPAPNVNGWNSTDVSVAFTVDDPSGIATATPGPLLLSTEGAEVTGTVNATDNAGNTASVTSPAVKIDKTMPTVSITTPADGAAYPAGTTITASYTCADALSGIRSCDGPVPSGNSIDTGSAGFKTFTVSAVDAAGNAATHTISYSVATPAPTIATFAPASGSIGTVITVGGTDFTGATAVTLNDIAAAFTVISATQITATVPAGATSGTIKVTTPGGTATSAAAFTVLAAPTISTFTPTSGPVGTEVTITGANFTGAMAMTFNGVSATFSVTSATQLMATVPPSATTGLIGVTTPDGTATSTTNFTVPSTAAPAISGFSPTGGPVGTSVTITGTNLGTASAVAFNGTSATFRIRGSSQITTSVPVGATSGPITVATPGGTATSASAFTVVALPTISGFSPVSGPAGTLVTITGANFTGATTVKFGGSSGQFSVISDTRIVATVPTGAKTGPIAVTTPAGTVTSSSSFKVAK